MPCGYVLVGQAAGDIEHDDGALPMDVVAIPQPCGRVSAACEKVMRGSCARVQILCLPDVLLEHQLSGSRVPMRSPTSELLLPGSVPAVEPQLAAICGEV